MNAQRFKALLDAHGGDPRRWPEAEREAARGFAQACEGRAAVKAAQALDEQLDAWTAGQPSPELRARVLAAARRPRPWAGFQTHWARVWAPGAGLAAAGLAGVLFGAVLADRGDDSSVERLLAEAGAYDDAALPAEAAL